MTQAKELDVEGFVALLNQDLATEYQSIVQYINHIATITGAEFLSVIDELKLHLGQELSHAQVLAEQVSFGWRTRHHGADRQAGC
jgi:bacterioferritin